MSENTKFPVAASFGKQEARRLMDILLREEVVEAFDSKQLAHVRCSVLIEKNCGSVLDEKNYRGRRIPITSENIDDLPAETILAANLIVGGGSNLEVTTPADSDLGKRLLELCRITIVNEIFELAADCDKQISEAKAARANCEATIHRLHRGLV